MIVNADLRWPVTTGIGAVQTEIVRRKPPEITLRNLEITTRIGSPISPLSIAKSLGRYRSHLKDVFWSPGFIPPAWSAIPGVITVHDLTHMHYYTTMHAAYYKSVMLPLYRKCARIICVSDFTRNELLNCSRVDPDRVITIHNGVSPGRFSDGPNANLPYPYVLYVGNRRNYKNLNRLLHAFSISSLPRDGVTLLLSGVPDIALQELAKGLKIQDHLKFCGIASDQDIARLYRGARIVAFVSLYEGFGFPILEAMAAGVPVLTSDVSAMPEIAGDAALTVNPTHTDEIANGLERLHSDDTLRSTLVHRGRLNIRRFSWSASASATWDTVRAA